MSLNCSNLSGFNRRKSEGTIVTPGPGCYTVSRELSKRSVAFTRASRSSDKCRLSPGPGSYNIPSEFGKGPKARFPSGRNSSELTQLPGPSDYSPYYCFSSIKYSFPRHQSIKPNEITPGPGDYDIAIKSSVPKATIGKARRLLLDSTKNDSSLNENMKKRTPSRRNSHLSTFSGLIDKPEKSLKTMHRKTFTNKKSHGENIPPNRGGSVKRNSTKLYDKVKS